MAQHKAIISWNCVNNDFRSGKFSRHHTWTFDGGLTVPASPAPSVVPPPLSDPADIDPEEAFVASLASCHMLTYLYIAWRKGFSVDSYQDEAVADMAKGANGVPWVAKITLNPKVTYSGEKQPTADEAKEMHHVAHEQCYIANSIKTEVVIAG